MLFANVLLGGAKIAGLDKDAQGLEMLAEELSSMGASANTFVCDVTDEVQ